MSLDILCRSCQLTATILPNGIGQLFSENIIEVSDTLHQHKLQQKSSVKKQSCFPTFHGSGGQLL